MPMLDIGNQAAPPEVTMENVRFNQDYDGNDVPATGQVYLSRKITVDVFVDFDYWAFPFDEHLMPVEVSSFAYGARAVELRSLVIQKPTPKQSNIAWEILGTKTIVTGGASLYTDEDSILTVYTAVKRIPMAEMCTIIVPLMVIVVFTFSALFISHEDNFSDQLAVSSFGFLTVMAYSTVIYSDIPKTSYSLWIHNFVLYGVIFTLLIMVAVGVVHCTTYGCCDNPFDDDKKKKGGDDDEDQPKLSETMKKEMELRRETARILKIDNMVIFWRVALPCVYAAAVVYSFYRVESYQSKDSVIAQGDDLVNMFA